MVSQSCSEVTVPMGGGGGPDRVLIKTVSTYTVQVLIGDKVLFAKEDEECQLHRNKIYLGK